MLEGKIKINLLPDLFTGTIDFKLKIKYEKDYEDFPIKLKQCTDSNLDETEWE